MLCAFYFCVMMDKHISDSRPEEQIVLQPTAATVAGDAQGDLALDKIKSQRAKFLKKSLQSQKAASHPSEM